MDSTKKEMHDNFNFKFSKFTISKTEIKLRYANYVAAMTWLSQINLIDISLRK